MSAAKRNNFLNRRSLIAGLVWCYHGGVWYPGIIEGTRSHLVGPIYHVTGRFPRKADYYASHVRYAFRQVHFFLQVYCFCRCAEAGALVWPLFVVLAPTKEFVPHVWKALSSLAQKAGVRLGVLPRGAWDSDSMMEQRREAEHQASAETATIQEALAAAAEALQKVALAAAAEGQEEGSYCNGGSQGTVPEH